MKTKGSEFQRFQELWPGDWSEAKLDGGYVYSVVTGNHQIKVFSYSDTSSLRAEVSTRTSMFITSEVDARKMMLEIAMHLSWNSAQEPEAKTPLSRWRQEHVELASQRADLITKKFKGQDYDTDKLEKIEGRIDELDSRLYAPSIDQLNKDIGEAKKMKSDIEKLLFEAKAIIEQGESNA